MPGGSPDTSDDGPGANSTVRPEAAEPSQSGGVEISDLDEPEAVLPYTLGETQQVRLAGTVISRIVLQPGWSWLEHAQPQAGTPSCELYHRGVVLRGRFGVRPDHGGEVVIGPNQVFDIHPGHVTWMEGDEEVIMLDWAGGAGFGVAPGTERR